MGAIDLVKLYGFKIYQINLNKFMPSGSKDFMLT